MQAARCREGCSATTADFVAARRLIAVTGSDTAATITITIAITAGGSSAATSSSATTSTTAAAATLGQRGTCRQSGDCENDHEHSKSCHVAPPL